MALATGQLLDFKIVLRSDDRGEDLVYGRTRWSADGRSIIYIGQEKSGRVSVSSQPFVPGQDTSGARFKLSARTTFYSVESMGLSPDGKQLAISALFNRQQLVLAEKLKLKAWD